MNLLYGVHLDLLCTSGGQPAIFIAEGTMARYRFKTRLLSPKADKVSKSGDPAA